MGCVEELCITSPGVEFALVRVVLNCFVEALKCLGVPPHADQSTAFPKQVLCPEYPRDVHVLRATGLEALDVVRPAVLIGELAVRLAYGSEYLSPQVQHFLSRTRRQGVGMNKLGQLEISRTNGRCVGVLANSQHLEMVLLFELGHPRAKRVQLVLLPWNGCRRCGRYLRRSTIGLLAGNFDWGRRCLARLRSTRWSRRRGNDAGFRRLSHFFLTLRGKWAGRFALQRGRGRTKRKRL